MARQVATVVGVVIGGATGGMCGLAVCFGLLFLLGPSGPTGEPPIGMGFCFCTGAICGAWAMGRAFWRASSKPLLGTVRGATGDSRDVQQPREGSKPLVGIAQGAAVLVVTGLPLCFLVSVEKGSDSAVWLWPGVGLLALEVLWLRWFARLRAWQLLASITLCFIVLCPVMAVHYAATQGQTHGLAELEAICFAAVLWGILAGAALVAEAIAWVYTRPRDLDRESRQD